MTVYGVQHQCFTNAARLCASYRLLSTNFVEPHEVPA